MVAEVVVALPLLRIPDSAIEELWAQGLEGSLQMLLPVLCGPMSIAYSGIFPRLCRVFIGSAAPLRVSIHTALAYRQLLQLDV
jgi:hypothetical protein